MQSIFTTVTLHFNLTTQDYFFLGVFQNKIFYNTSSNWLWFDTYYNLYRITKQQAFCCLDLSLISFTGFTYSCYIMAPEFWLFNIVSTLSGCYVIDLSSIFYSICLPTVRPAELDMSSSVDKTIPAVLQVDPLLPQNQTNACKDLNVDSLLLLSEIYNRQSLVYDKTLCNNNNNFINLKNINNNFNINSLNDRVYFYSSRFKIEDAWNRSAIAIFNVVNLDFGTYLALLQKSLTPYNIKIC